MVEKIARKQYSYMTDLMNRWASNPSNFAAEKALIDYQEEIRWPWKATEEQRKDWEEHCPNWDAQMAKA